ncbi:hypothetical protein DAI22_03g291550 [Oryza sativa Japonica Group]|nr:hypothetical protein DAI22_03g291550 [Oryza sativa Japonica Group]
MAVGGASPAVGGGSGGRRASVGGGGKAKRVVGGGGRWWRLAANDGEDDGQLAAAGLRQRRGERGEGGRGGGPAGWASPAPLTPFGQPARPGGGVLGWQRRWRRWGEALRSGSGGRQPWQPGRLAPASKNGSGGAVPVRPSAGIRWSHASRRGGDVPPGAAATQLHAYTRRVRTTLLGRVRDASGWEAARPSGGRLCTAMTEAGGTRCKGG